MLDYREFLSSYVYGYSVWANYNIAKEEDCLQMCKGMQDCAYVVFAEFKQGYDDPDMPKCSAFPSTMIARPGSPPAVPMLETSDEYQVC
jgi:hypothetical protein